MDSSGMAAQSMSLENTCLADENSCEKRDECSLDLKNLTHRKKMWLL